MNSDDLKMYILIKDTCPDDLAPLIAGHAVMGTYLKFMDNDLMIEWAASPHFKKVVCKVHPKIFTKAKQYGEHNIITECNRPELGEMGMAFNIQKEYPKFFKYLRLYKVEVKLCALCGNHERMHCTECS